MKNALRTLSFFVIVLIFMTFTACYKAADESNSGLLSTSAKIGSGAVQGSITEFTKAIKLDSTSARVYAGRGALKYAMGDNKAAIADLTKAIDLDPESATAYSGRATAKYAEGDIPGATADLISATKIVVFSSFSK